MKPVNFEGSNQIFTTPKGMTTDQCGNLHAFKGLTDDGFPYILTCWQPSEKDIEAIINGQPVVVQVISTSFAPMSLWTMNEDGTANAE